MFYRAIYEKKQKLTKYVVSGIIIIVRGGVSNSWKNFGQTAVLRELVWLRGAVVTVKCFCAVQFSIFNLKVCTGFGIDTAKQVKPVSEKRNHGAKIMTI